MSSGIEKNMQTFTYKSILFAMTLGIALCGFFLISPAVQYEVTQIDQKIEELQEIKRGYIAKALRHEDYAQRLQFDDEAHLEARRHNALAQENREKARMVQLEIDRLKEEKKNLLGKNAPQHG